MKFPFSLFLALRYLKPKRTFLSIITFISVFGVMLGITVLIVVISVMTGFDHELRRKILGFEPHLIVTSDAPIANWRPIKEKIDKTPGVVSTAPYIQGPVIVDHEGHIYTPMIRGIDLAAEKKIVDVEKLISLGKADLSGEDALIGSRLAMALGVTVGDKVTIYAPGNIRSIIEEMKRSKSDPNAKAKTLADLEGDVVMPAELTVTGIFESGRYDYDFSIIFVPLHIGQELYSLGGDIHGLSIETTDPYHAESVKRTLNGFLPEPIFAQTWIDRNKDRFDAIRVERNVMFIILMFLIVIAAFSIMSTLITVTVQKRREIGIMKALGARTWQVIWVFLSQGMIVGFFGNLAGLGLGMLLVRYRDEFRTWLANVLHIQLFPADIYEFNSIPAEVVPHDVAVICISAFFICSIAALIPAWFAARLDPVKALRYE